MITTLLRKTSLKPQRNQARSLRSRNGLLGGWVLVAPSRCKYNAVKKITANSTIIRQQWVSIISSNSSL